jgi:hypothetical protein
MPFQYQPYSSPFAGSIAQLIARRGEIAAHAAELAGQANARAAEQSGAAWANGVQNTGQILGALPLQMVAARRAQSQDQLQQIAVTEAQQRHAGGAAVDTMMRGDQLPAGDVGPRQSSYLDANGLFDIPKMTAALGQAGIGHLAPELLKGAESINDSILKHQELEQKTAQQQTILIGDLADGALKLSKSGVSLVDAMDFAVQPALATKRIKPEDYQRLRAQIAALPPDQQTAAMNQFMDQAAKMAPTKTLGKDAQESDRYGRVITTNLQAEPNKGDYTGPDGIRYHANGTPVTGQVMRPQVPPSAAQTHNMRLKGVGDVPVDYVPGKDGTGGTWMYQGKDVTGQVTAIPSAAITIHNENAKGPDLPVWATDDSRPTGPDANKLDPRVRMTPNGLYQAAMNNIATGQFPPTGRGSDPASVATRTAITSKVGAIAAAAGMDEPALRAFYKSNAASLAQQQKMQDSVQGFMATADKNAALLQESLKNIPDVGVPLFNKPLRAFASSVSGDPNMSRVATYLQSVQNEYARIIAQPNLAGQLTDSARHEAEALLDPKATVPQILASIDALQKEGNNRLVSVGEQIQRIQQRMQVGPSAAPPAPSAPIKVGGFTVKVKGG